MVRTMTLSDALFVVSRMREMDRACVRALMGDVGDDDFAANRWGTTGPAWTVCDAAGMPVAIFGVSVHSAWHAVGWLVATDALGDGRCQSWRELLRCARTVARNLSDPEHEQYRHRVEAHVLSTWDGARRFAGWLGLHHEGTRRSAGKGGEDIETWALIGPPRSEAG